MSTTAEPAHDPTCRPDRKERTATLLGRAAAATPADRAALLDEVIVLNLPVAHSLAARYRNRGQPIEELEQVAALALTRAVQGYRPERGEDLLVFAVPTILGELRRYFRDTTWVVRPPRRLQELRPQVVAAQDELTQQLGRAPLPRELATHLSCAEGEILAAIDVVGSATTVSLDQPAGGIDMPWLDRLPTTEPGFLRAEAVVALAPACRRLQRRDRLILRMRFYEQLTQQQIADELGVTQVQVSRLLQRIIRDLRRSLGAAGKVRAA